MNNYTVTASAPGKIIIFGEHAVVYGRPAIAAPVHGVQAQATVTRCANTMGTIIATDLKRSCALDAAAADELFPLCKIARDTLARLGITAPRDIEITVQSTIPIARGMGSGAAISTAIVRALARYYDAPLNAADISALVYETEKLHHGTPSGIDNTVIAYEQPVYFVKGAPLEFVTVGAPLTFIIADSGAGSLTKEVVGDVRRAWRADRERYEGYFDEIGAVAQQGRVALGRGDAEALGRLMNENHELLQQICVSSERLNVLVNAARDAGALGAKLSGAGRGGNMIALINPDDEPRVRAALRGAGAARVITTRLGAMS